MLESDGSDRQLGVSQCNSNQIGPNKEALLVVHKDEVRTALPTDQ